LTSTGGSCMRNRSRAPNSNILWEIKLIRGFFPDSFLRSF
jgi:hypothetical protein